MKETDFRVLSELEKRIFEKLLSLNFTGNAELKKQIPCLLVKRIDDNGSLQLKVENSPASQVPDGPAVEARYPDADTNKINPACINLLLHTRGGKLWMLEIYKDDSTSILKTPNPDDFQLFSRFEKWAK